MRAQAKKAACTRAGGGREFSFQPLEGAWPCPHLDLGQSMMFCLCLVTSGGQHRSWGALGGRMYLTSPPLPLRLSGSGAQSRSSFLLWWCPFLMVLSPWSLGVSLHVLVLPWVSGGCGTLAQAASLLSS